jgi:hypothetical protein
VRVGGVGLLSPLSPAMTMGFDTPSLYLARGLL